MDGGDSERRDVTWGLPVRTDPEPGMRRRSLLQWMGASLALALGVPGCVRKPPRGVVSRESEPEHRLPGVPRTYASTWTAGRFPYGIIVKTVDGRPIKVDGNPHHPVNRGASSAAMQASVLSLYDPTRLRAPRGVASWAEADARITRALTSARRAVIVTRPTLGPSERAVLAALLERYPGLSAFGYEPAGDRPRRVAWRDLYGRDGDWIPRFERARVVVSIGCDFLATDGVVLEASRAFAEARAPDDLHPERTRGCRLYVVEGDLSLTGMNADHHLRLRPSAYAGFLHGVREAVSGQVSAASVASAYGLDPAVVTALVRDLREARGAALVVAGGGLPPAVHAEAALLDDDLSAPGRTLEWNPFAFPIPDDPEQIRAALAEGPEVLILMGVNPVHSWPGGAFADLIRRAPLSVAHSLQPDETAIACTIALPSHHELESWNDAAPRAGLVSLCQPTIRPLHDSRQEAVSLMTWAGMPADGTEEGEPRPSFREFVRRRLEREVPWDGPGAWTEALRTGVVVREGPPADPPPLDRDRAERIAAGGRRAAEVSSQGGSAVIELEMRPHPAVDDGRFGTLPWLLEAPDPIARLTWDNALRLSPRTAEALSVSTGDLVAVLAGGASVELPVLVVPGVAEGVGGVDLGMGRFVEDWAALTGDPGGGFNAWPLVPGDVRVRADAVVERTGRTYPLALAQTTFDMQGRPIVLESSVQRFRRDPAEVQRRRVRSGAPSLYGYDYTGTPKWEMVIDLHRCTGCGACVIACQAENNIMPVGKKECALGRELHWMRIDLYRQGDPDNPEHLIEPMLCQHCDQAPCENVCPVNAATHSPDGLNEQVYNRCIGTRYCANNCPYKVRRFNFYRYSERFMRDPGQRWMTNPSVTVRQVGVMEKCTFCVQRIRAARFRAANEGRAVRDGEVVPACAQVCPTRAITFGDANHTGENPSEVVRWKQSPRAFKVLEDLNVGPNVTYLARLRNPGTEGES